MSEADVHNILNTAQLASGVAVLISFYAGYKYGIKLIEDKLKSKLKGTQNDNLLEPQPSTSKKAIAKSPSTAQTTAEIDNQGVDMSNLYSDTGEYKMMLIVRNDLKMGKGKIAAQCGHASVGAYESAMRKYPIIVKQWMYCGSPKIAVKVESEKEMMDIRLKALAKDFNICLIRDAGRTQIEPNSKTVLAIGPAPARKLDELTGHLKLL